MYIIGFCKRSHHDRILLFFLRHFFGRVCIKIDLPNRSPRGSIYTFGEERAVLFRVAHRFFIELWMKKGIYIIWCYT